MKRIIILMVICVSLCAAVSCGNMRTGQMTETAVTTIKPHIPAVPLKIENKEEYEIKEVYGYCHLRLGKKKDDIWVEDIVRNKAIEILLSESDVLNKELKKEIFEEYNVDISAFNFSLVSQAIDEHIDYIYKDFFYAERTEIKIFFFETENGKCALEYEIDFHIYETDREYWESDFRHFIVYLN